MESFKKRIPFTRRTKQCHHGELVHEIGEYCHIQLVVSSSRPSPPSCHPLGQINYYRNILLYVSSLISMVVSHFDCKQNFLVQKNVPVKFIQLKRWQDGAESLGIETKAVYGMHYLSTFPLLHLGQYKEYSKFILLQVNTQSIVSTHFYKLVPCVFQFS